MSNRCFVLEENCKQDLSTTATFGRVVYVFKKRDSRSSIWSAAYRTELIAQMRQMEFDPANDYFVAAGHQVPMIIAIAELIKIYGEIKVLMYYAPDRHYTAMTLGENNVIRSG